MSGYEFAYTWIGKHSDKDGFMQTELFLGLRPMVPAAIVFSSLARALFESKLHMICTVTFDSIKN